MCANRILVLAAASNFQVAFKGKRAGLTPTHSNSKGYLKTSAPTQPQSIPSG
ncbi:hypothetical protein EIKCOROL_00525 [Eikenella corrodens ATCC 23834]|uniref:Uncharacterized protein n=1 Tax=Eikenella corrodens ATCC 23834 TaxID=546274 RepID=C0DT48_EIKCO|nr:hypothetical protein EIKCOROL_00525 [Eikenella corrodens ATCC 23834]